MEQVSGCGAAKHHTAACSQAPQQDRGDNQAKSKNTDGLK